jgi:L-Ala-D/L-Glu epimerase
MRMGPLTLSVAIEQWPLKAPFRTAGRTFDDIEIVRVTLEAHGALGHGEAAGVYYLDESAAGIRDQIERLRPALKDGFGRDRLQELLPIGGARNALDCALWDLEAKLTGRSVWQIAGLERPGALLTTFTCGADDPENMAAAARAYTHARAIKIKLTGEPIDAQRVRTVRSARPDVWLGIDANQSFTRDSLARLMALLVESNVAVIEQPFRVGAEALLDGFESPIPIAADESVQGLADMPALVGRFDIVNIKLDKCGGLTEALAMARAARELGLEAMVGCMPATSLAMAPAVLVGQLCRIVDLDAPMFLKNDRAIAARYQDGLITYPDALWGNPTGGG